MFYFLISSPLDQFDTYPVFFENLHRFFNDNWLFHISGVGIFYYGFGLWNALVLTFIGCYITLIFLRSFHFRIFIVPNAVGYKYFFNILFNLVRSIILPIFVSRKQYLSFSLFIFLSVLSKNLYSQLPGSKAATATIQVPFSYSITACVGFNLLYVWLNRPIESIGFFAPSAIPLNMTPFLWVIEFISHLMKVISLAVRLCANISSGHVLLDIILTALFLILIKGGTALIFVFFIFQGLGFAIQILETFIGFLQAFVFLTLTSIYTGEMFVAGH